MQNLKLIGGSQFLRLVLEFEESVRSLGVPAMEEDEEVAVCGLNSSYFQGSEKVIGCFEYFSDFSTGHFSCWKIL